MDLVSCVLFPRFPSLRHGMVYIASKNPILTGIAGTAAKPSFLLWDKVWAKVNDPIEEVWLLRAATAVLEWFEGGNGKKTAGVKLVNFVSA